MVRELGAVCGSTAMIVTMHFSATAAIVAASDKETLAAITNENHHLSTLAFSRDRIHSHFWAPLGTAAAEPDGTCGLEYEQELGSSSGRADSYVWFGLPLTPTAPMTLWLVPADSPGLSVAGAFNGLGLRGNASAPVTPTRPMPPARWCSRRRRLPRPGPGGGAAGVPDLQHVDRRQAPDAQSFAE